MSTRGVSHKKVNILSSQNVSWIEMKIDVDDRCEVTARLYTQELEQWRTTAKKLVSIIQISKLFWENRGNTMKKWEQLMDDIMQNEIRRDLDVAVPAVRELGTADD